MINLNNRIPHRLQASRSLLQEGGSGMVEEEPTSGLSSWNPRPHGYAAAISFGLALPLAAVISRNFRVRARLRSLMSKVCPVLPALTRAAFRV